MDFESIASAYSANPAKNRRFTYDAYIIPQKNKSARGVLPKISFFILFPSLLVFPPFLPFLFFLFFKPYPRSDFNSASRLPPRRDASRPLLPPRPNDKKKKNPDQTQSFVGAKYRIPESNRDALAGNGF